MDRILVTGGAGFVGSHVCKGLRRAGWTPVTFDNLATGWQDAVKFGPLLNGDILNRAAVGAAFAEWNPVAVIHLAALTSVEESVSRPEAYRQCNVEGTRNVLDAMREHGCRAIVFSSTCAVYGNAASGLVTEQSSTNPESPYAETKLAAEELIFDVSAGGGIGSMIFRYFNVAGSDPEQEIGERRRIPSNLIPAVLECAAGTQAVFEIFGTDLATPDGTCIRDFVHANDVADAHILGLRAVLDGKVGGLFNLGTGKGNSVREVVERSRLVTGIGFPVREAARRPGDVARIVSDCARARAELGWSAQSSQLETIITDAWNWRRCEAYASPAGFG
ncbi:MAG: UDP-glucose 4-epimerase GalE [Rhodobacteraceae bacterium]|nr:UDP-glucose 4-epimerase GalE [Paracoccaceae bacterium]